MYDQFVTDLRSLGISCEFGDTNEALQDQFALNIKNPRIKQTIMSEALTIGIVH